MTYKHVARCPVCSEVFDILEGPTPEPDGQAAAMLLGEYRRDHAEQSPACTEDRRWVKGWTFDKPEEIK